jgi:large subunit ribosomal protein L4
MAKIEVLDIEKRPVSEREVADAVFQAEVKGHLIHDMVRYQLAGRRQGTAATKGRSEVAGGGKKPYRQKGTGNARQGCVRAPHYVGGGVVFGSHPRDYSFKLNRKVKKSALKSALSLKFKNEQVMVFKSLDHGKVSTKEFSGFLRRLGINSALVVIPDDNPNVVLSARNIPNIKVVRAVGVNVYDLMKHQNVLITEDAVSQLEGALS